MSRSRHRGPKHSQPMPNVVRLIRQLQQQPGHGGRLACGYGVHDFQQDQPREGFKHCCRCSAVHSTRDLAEALAGLFLRAAREAGQQ